MAATRPNPVGAEPRSSAIRLESAQPAGGMVFPTGRFRVPSRATFILSGGRFYSPLVISVSLGGDETYRQRPDSGIEK